MNVRAWVPLVLHVQTHSGTIRSRAMCVATAFEPRSIIHVNGAFGRKRSCQSIFSDKRNFVDGTMWPSTEPAQTQRGFTW
jgi:hypothetical protein